MDRVSSGAWGSGFAEFDRLALLFRRTREALGTVLETGDLPDAVRGVLATETLPHIEDVEAGFRSRLRAAETSLAELRQLVLQGGLGLPEPRDTAEARAALIEAMRARAGAGGEPNMAPVPPHRLVALEHARLALALLPDTPEPNVRYPAGRRTYADISAPRSPTEFVQRVEEIERTIWGVAAGGRRATHDSAYRRVYGFFDVGERLISEGFRLS